MMRTSSVSILIGLTATLTVSAPIAAQAASFNFDALPNIKVRPLSSTNQLNFFGDLSTNQGYTAFFNLDPNAPDQGHREISLNSPGNIAPYYTTGRHASIEDPSTNANSSASLTGGNGFTSFFSYLTNNNLDLSQIGFSYGQKEGVDFKKTWNFGEDKLGQDYFASPTSTLEERIYQANPNDVEIFLTYGDTKIIDIGYTPFYSLFDYGATTSTIDDAEAVITELVSANTRSGLNDPLLAGLANAFLKDVKKAGGKVQLVYEDFAVDDVGFTFGGGGEYGVVRLPFPLTIRAGAAVPEPSTVLGSLFLAGFFGTVAYRRRSRSQKSTKKLKF
ncbi:PEP-CTERM sorting domain-containing protein [Merismopedia glauca]|uniref:Exosortase n=1 Tax=Merismopedia glauca CCAP 1448/3 TaxID=1296344 RepID=A0A2T1C711_9CYAN|nr:PEP-CTERM sorting domain-containing protein [Merismopedia glauca]PSB03933.1 exosortase [Merismopedia glauca CCAP 1448/3]